MQPGERVAHYEVQEAVGRGGMGVVYRARDTKLDRIVALKFLPADAAGDEEAKKRFVMEARAASALDHPNICTIHDIDETDDGHMYIVMAYYEGRTLQERLRSESFSVARTVEIARQRAIKTLPPSVASALRAGSEAGITLADNVAAFRELRWSPSVADKPDERDLSVEVLGQQLSLPVLIAPVA